MRTKQPQRGALPSARPQDRAARRRKIAAAVPPLLRWFARNARDLPWRRTQDPYAIWIAEVMLQQTQVKTVVPYWECWTRALPDVPALASASPEEILKLWAGLGYYGRARNLHVAAKIIVNSHAGQFPRDYEAILALPGIGRYTAGAICSIAFDEPKPVLDGNVIRVLTRLFGIAENPREPKTNALLWDLAGRLVRFAARLHSPARQATSDSRPASRPCSHLNQALMELGALVCAPRQPRCGVCPLARHCVGRQQGSVERLPNLAPRRAVTSKRFIAFVAEHRGRFLVRQRPAEVINAHLWEFPNVEVSAAGTNRPRLAAGVLGVEPLRLVPLGTIKHSITRYRIACDAFLARLPTWLRPKLARGRWATLDELQALALPSAQKKILERLKANSV